MVYIKRTVKILIFLALLVAVTSKIYGVLEWNKGIGIRQFYLYEKDTVDVITYGSSHAFCTANPPVMWQDHGIAMVNMGESGQTIGSTYYYMKESLKYQKPKVALVEMRGFAVSEAGYKNGNMYKNILGLHLSKDYLENLDYLLSLTKLKGQKLKEEKQFLIAKFPMYHARYNELTKEDFSEVSNEMGRFSGSWTSEPYKVPKGITCRETTSLSKAQKKWIDKFVALAKENDVELVFWVAPYYVNTKSMKIYNAVAEYAATKDVACINFNEIYEKIGFDYKTDMRAENHSGSHVNNYGAEKVTNYLTDYLLEHYDLPDRRGEKGYEIYQTIYENWLLNVKEKDDTNTE